MIRVAVIQFPGTNCDRDVFEMCEAKEMKPRYIWHLDQFENRDFDMVILPGGFSYGDYLRSGALSARSPVMSSVRSFANFGGPILGICNGFQVLTESGLLPGALVKNESRRFCDAWVDLEIVNDNPYFAKDISKSKTVKIPVAHGDGRFFADKKTLDELESHDQVWFRYKKNPNGSMRDIAGVMNNKKNVVGLMPHPERALYSWMGSVDGWSFL